MAAVLLLACLLLGEASADIRWGYDLSPDVCKDYKSYNHNTAQETHTYYYYSYPVPTVELKCDPTAVSENSVASCMTLLPGILPHVGREYTVGDDALQVVGLTSLEAYDAYHMGMWGSAEAGQALACWDAGYGCMKTIQCTMKATVTRTCEYNSGNNLQKSSDPVTCRMCVHGTCPNVIGNGAWAGPLATYKDYRPTIYSILTPAVPNIVPQTCALGTWLTCVSSSREKGCQYPVPSHEQSLLSWLQEVASYSKVDTIWAGTDTGLPNYGCYKCPTAANKMHYGVTGFDVPITYSSVGMLPFYCPGGSSPPVLCKNDMDGPHGVYIGADQRTGECQCMPGYYPRDPDQPNGICLPCEPGFYCSIDPDDPQHRTVKRLCPEGYFQDQRRQTSCKPCDQTVCDMKGYARTACVTKDGTNPPEKWKTTNAQCVRCTTCDEFDPQNGRPCLDVLGVQAAYANLVN